VGSHDADGPAALHEQRLVVFEVAQGPDDPVEVGPASRGLARAAVDDQLVGLLGDVGVEVVVQHAEGGLLVPALAGALRSSRGVDDARPAGRVW